MVRRAERGRGRKVENVGTAKQGFVLAHAHASLPLVDCELCLIPSQDISHSNWQHHRAADLHSSPQPVSGRDASPGAAAPLLCHTCLPC